MEKSVITFGEPQTRSYTLRHGHETFDVICQVWNDVGQLVQAPDARVEIIDEDRVRVALRSTLPPGVEYRAVVVG